MTTLTVAPALHALFDADREEEQQEQAAPAGTSTYTYIRRSRCPQCDGPARTEITGGHRRVYTEHDGSCPFRPRADRMRQLTPHVAGEAR